MNTYTRAYAAVPASALAIGLAVTLALAGAASAEEKRLPVTADLGICAHPGEQAFNTGGRSAVRVKGNEHYYLFTFDAAEVRAWRIEKATLHLKLAQGHLRKVALCTVPAAWVEGTAGNEPQKGSTCFTHLRYPDAAWTAQGGTMLDATFNSPFMRWEAADVAVDKDNWLTIDIPPALAQAVAAGWSHGLALADEKGQTMENHDVYTRKQASARPYVTVQGAPHPPALRPATLLSRPAFSAKPCPQAADFTTGGIVVDAAWPKPPQVLVGHRIRIFENTGERADLKPPVRQAVTFGDPAVEFRGLKPQAEYLVAVETLADGLVIDATMTTVKASAALAAPPPIELKPPDSMKRQYRADGWTAEFHAVSAKLSPDAQPLARDDGWVVPSCGRNAWTAFQVAVMPPQGQAQDVTVELTPPAYQGPDKAAAAAPLKGQVFRQWYVRADKAWHAEVLAPLEAKRAIAVPWKDNGVPGQTCLPLLVDIWVPKDAPAGPCEGKLAIRQAGKEVLSLPVRLNVGTATLGDEYRIVGDCNTYDSPASAMGVKTSDPRACMAMERKYYRLAHAHRMTLNVLPYSQAGETHWRGAPAVEAVTSPPPGGGSLRVSDWSAWDERYGPLLSGQAFSAATGYVGPGESTPIHHMYLPLHENWPAKLAEHFKPWPPPKDYQAFLKWSADLPPIEQCLDGAYAAAWQTVLTNIASHVSSAYDPPRTQLQVFLNDKYFFRDPREGGRGISLWLLDEPSFADDFLSLRFFATMTRPVAEGARTWHKSPTPIQFRLDISRPTHQRTWLDGLVDLNVCGGQLYGQRRLIDYRKRRFGEQYWNYAMPPSFGSDNAGWAAWPVASYCWGAVGTLPWQTIGSDGDLDKASAIAMMYPGRKLGADEPLACLRMKAWRDGLQDAELLRMLREKKGWNELQLRYFVAQACGLGGGTEGFDPPADAEIVTFKTMDDAKLQHLRRAALAMLDARE